MKRWLTLLMVCVFSSGCGTLHKNTPIATKATTQPSPNSIAIHWTQVFVDDFQPLMKLERGGENTEFSFKLSLGQDGDRVLYFGEIKNSDDQLMPVIAQRNGKHYVAVKMKKDWGSDQWQNVLYGTHDGEIWGLFDQSEENQTRDVTLLHSQDEGRSFQLAVLPKPCKDATFYDFVMAKDGSGRLTLALAKDCGPKIKAGLYHYRTTDGGQTWSRPQFEPDATQPADDVPDDEQPGQGQMAASAR
jgi:hypothetical protein